MAYDPSKPYTYGIPDGTYSGVPTTASFYEKDNRLILDIKFAVRDQQTGEFYKKDNGYPWEAQKRHWITSKDGGFNVATVNGIKEWAKGWTCSDLSSFYWFQQPDADGRAFGHLAEIGDVELNFVTDNTGAQSLWVHDPNRQRGTRTAFVPDGASTDQAAIMAKWGAKAKAVFASTPRKVQGGAASPAPASRPAAAPVDKPGAAYPQTADGAFAYYCSCLPEPYNSAKHDEKWFAIFDAAAGGKDPDQFTPADTARLFQAVADAMK